MEPQHKRGEIGENNRDHLRSSASQQYAVASKTNGVSGRKTHAMKNSDYLLGGRGKQTQIVREIDLDILQRLSRLELLKKNVHPSRKTVQCRNETDRQHKDHCCGICPHETNGTDSGRYKCVTFDMNLTVYEIPYEERGSEWMTMALDPFIYNHSKDEQDPRRHLTIIPSWGSKAEVDKRGHCNVCFEDNSHLQVKCTKCGTQVVCCRCIIGIYRYINPCPMCRHRGEQ